MLKVLAVTVAMLFLATTAFAQVGQEYDDDYEDVEDTLDLDNDIYIDNDDDDDYDDENGDDDQVIIQQNEYDRYERNGDEPAFKPWVGFGVHGGPVSNLSNDAVEESIDEAYDDITDFDFENDMTNLGVHLAVNSSKFLGFIAALDYTWRDQNIAGDVDLTSSIVSLTGDVNFIIPFVVSPFVGAGIGGYRTAQSLDADTITVILPDDETSFGWNLRAGLGVDVPDFILRPFVEWRYHRIETEDPVSYHAINFGLTFKFQ